MKWNPWTIVAVTIVVMLFCTTFTFRKTGTDFRKLQFRIVPTIFEVSQHANGLVLPVDLPLLTPLNLTLSNGGIINYPLFILDEYLLRCAASLDSNIPHLHSNSSKNADDRAFCFNESRSRVVQLGTPPENMKPVFENLFLLLKNGVLSSKITISISQTTSVITLRSSATQNSEVTLKIYPIDVKNSYWLIYNFEQEPHYKSSAFEAAIPRPEIVQYIFSNGVSVFGPSKPSLYVTLIRQSRLLQCNRSMAENMKKSRKHIESPSISSEQFVGLGLLRDLIYSLDMVPLLFGGTLLGWYRECGVIPDTSDLDLALTYDMWDERLTKTLLESKHFHIWRILGEEHDSIEYTVTYKGARIDIFLLYHNQNETWYSGMIPDSKTKLRYKQPKPEGYCTAILLDELFHIPCNFIDFLVIEYGEDFSNYIPQSRYIWFRTPKNVRQVGKYSNETWPMAYLSGSKNVVKLRKRWHG